MKTLYRNQTQQDYTTSTSFSHTEIKLDLQNQDIEKFIHNSQIQTLRSRALLLGEIQLDGIKLPLYTMLEGPISSAIAADDLHRLFINISSALAEQSIALDSQLDCSPTDIYQHVEEALKHYYNLVRLCQNPLIQILDLNKLCPERSSSSQTAGIALRALLDKALDTITGPKPGLNLTAREKWRVEHYLHLRYREEIQHQELVDWMGYSQRALLRKRRTQIMDTAAFMIHEMMCH